MQHSHACQSPQHELSRRQVLGSLAGAAAGVGLSGLLQPAAAADMKAKQKQVLLIWLDGGISQLESWDPKPNTEFGGPFRAMPTSMPGVHFSELMPNTAKQMHRISVVRSMCTKDENHSSGVPRILRGDPMNRGVTYPYLGAAVAKLKGDPNSDLPNYIWVKPGSGGYIWQHAGFLGSQYGALALGDGKPPIHINRPPEITDEVDKIRNNLRKKINNRFRAGRRDADIGAYEYSFDVAEKLIQRKDLFADFDPKDLERYGSHPLGRHILQSRRLLEAGVLFIQCHSYHWDTHGDNFNMHLDLVPQIDKPYAALIEDLDERGMLDNVLVILMSEFGRTPKINQRLGRDHWPEAWSVALAGGGIKRGAVIGKTTANGAWVDDKEYDIGHLFHTIFKTIGIDSKKTEYHNNGQPLPIAHDDMHVINELLA
jgi:hypothetical protein